MLTKGAINTLLRISSTNVSDSIVDLTLQIINLNLQSKQKNCKKDFDLYTCTLGDTKYSYSGFILPVVKEKQNLKPGDIIKLTKISTSKLTYNGCKIVIIKNYDFIKKEEIKNNLTNVESYEDIQNKMEEEDKRKQKNEELNDSNIALSGDNPLNLDNNENIENQNNNQIESKIKIINPDEIDMKTVINLSQISTFTKNICLYVKITRKFPQRKFYNKTTNKQSRLLSFDLMDTSGFEMQAIIFDETIERLSPILEEGNIYYIKGGYAKFNDKRFTNIKTDYRLIFDYNTQVTQVNKTLDTYFVKNGKDKIDIVKFEDLNNCKQNQVINCLAYILQIFPVMSKQSRIGNVLMRKLIICDSSLYKVQFTLWNKFTELDLKQGNILLLKYIRVGTYNNNICLTTIDNSFIDINPNMIDCKEYDELQKIINMGINEEDFKYISENETNNRSSIPEKSLCNNDIIYINTLIKILQNKFNEGSSRSDCSMIFTIKATVLQFEHGSKNFYLGCPNKMCRKKLIQKDEDYYCPGCETTTTEISYYYILNLRVIDISGEYTINLFGDQVTNLFGIDAKTYSDLIDNNEEEKLKEITKNIEYQTYYFYGKANIVKYGNRIKTQLFVYKFEKEDFKKEKNKIFGEIQECLNNIK